MLHTILYNLWPVSLCPNFRYYHVNGEIFGKNKLICSVFGLFLQVSSENCVSPWGLQSHVIVKARRFHVKCLSFQHDSSDTWVFLTYFNEFSQCQISRNPLAAAELLHAGRWTDVTQLIGTFRKPLKVAVFMLIIFRLICEKPHWTYCSKLILNRHYKKFSHPCSLSTVFAKLLNEALVI